MAAIEIELPSLLAAVNCGRSLLTVRADSLLGAYDALRQDHAPLALHLFEESGRLRQHVLCFLNETNTRWLNPADPALRDGDRLLFMQAVSGG